MANGGRIDFTVGFKTDKSGLNELKAQLNEFRKITPSELLKLNPDIKGMTEARKELYQIQKNITEIEDAFQSAFDPTTGVTNISKLNQSFKNLDIGKMQANFSKLGAVGTQTFTKIAAKAMTTNLQFKETNNILDRMGNTLINTLKWNISSSLINKFTGAFQEAYGYVQHLDTSLNDIRIVTGKSADEMDRFAVSANNAAKDLGKATTDYTEAALIYYQQGLADEEVQARTETTLKASNVTGQSASEVSEQLTAVWNGYRVSAEETEIAVDRLAAVAATTAADLEELSKGMSKVASAANSMGVDMDQLNATIATIESVTRQAPESVGTALKTIYARMGDLKVGESDEDGTELGEVSSTLQKVGIEILDVNGDLRDMGTVMEEIGEKWDTWSKAEQQAIAIAVAGKRQYNNLFALFDNWDMYTKALETSRNSVGTLQTQQDIYMESTAAHIQQLKTEWEDLYDSLLDTGTINSALDGFSKLINLATKFIDTIGGGKGVILGLGATFTGIFNKQISQALGSIITKFSNAKDNAKALEAELQITKTFSQNMGLNPKAVNEIVELKQYVQQYYDVMSQKEIQHQNNLVEEAAKIAIIKQDWELAGKAYLDYVKKLVEGQHNSGNQTFKGDATDADGKPKNTNYRALKDGNFLDEKTSELGNKAIENSIKAAEKAEQAYDKLIEKVKLYQEALKSGDSKKIDKAFEGVIKAQEEYNEAEEKFIKEAALDEQAQDKLAEAYNRTSESVIKLKLAYEDSNTTARQRGTASAVVTKALKNEKGTLAEVADETKRLGEEFQEEIPKIQEGFKEANQDLENFKNNIKAMGEFDTRQLVSGFSSLVSGITSVAFSFQTLKNLSSVWADETSSTVDKVLQTMISLGMVMPGIIALYNGLNAAKLIYNTLTSREAIAQGSLIVISGMAVNATAAQTLATTLLNDATFGLNKQLREQALAEIASTGTLSANTTALIINTAAKEGNADATALLNGGIQQAQGSTLQFANLLGGFKDKVAQAGGGLKGLASAGLAPVKSGFTGLASALGISVGALGALSVALAAVIAGIVIYNAHLKKIREQEANAAKARYDASQEMIDNTREEKNKIDELITSYKELREEYDKGSISIETLRDKTYQLALQYGDEELAIKALNGQYEELDEIINKLDLEKLEKIISAAEDAKDKTQDYLERDLWKNMTKGARDKVYDDTTGEYVEAIDLKGYGVKNPDERRLSSQLQDLGIRHYEDGHIDFSDFVTVARENRAELEKVLRDNAGTDAAKQLQEYLDQYKEVLDDYEADQEEAQDAREEKRNKDFSQSDLSTYENAKKAYDEYIKVALEEGLTWEQANEQFSKYADTLDNEFAKRLAQEQTTMAYLESGYLKYQNEHGIDTSNFEDTHAKTQELLDELSSRGLENDTSLLTAEEWENYYLGEWDIDKILSKMEERQTEKIEEIKNNFLNNSLTEFNDTFSKTMSSALNGELTSDDEGYGILKDQLNSIKDAFPELRSQIETFNNEGLIGTEHWIQAAHELQDFLNQIQFNQLNKKFKDEMDDITPTLDDTQFQKEMDELLDADYEINVKIHSDAEDEFEELEQSMDSMDSMADKIGEDFIVAADDLRELNNTFPGILEGMEYLADGTVQLNEDVVKSAMDAASKEEMASTEATITKLKNSAAELRAKAKVYDEMADLAWEAAKDEGNADKAKSEITTKLKELESENDKNVTDTEIDNAHLVVDDSATNAPILAENWTQSYQEAAKAANEWAEIAIAANEAVASNDPSKIKTIKTGDFGVNFTGQNSKASEKASIADVNNATSTDDWAVLAQKYTDTAEGLRKQANDIEGMAAELGAKAIDSIQKNKDIGSGKYSDSSGSDSSKDADHEEYLERETDLYRKINMELDDIEKTLGRIQNIESHEWGIDYQKSLEEENDLLDKQLDKLKQKKAIQEQDLSIRRKQLEDIGVSFNAEGSVMNNAEETLNSLYANYNAMAAKYNAMSAEQQEGFKATLETEKDRIEKIEKKMSEYESTFSDYQSTLDSLLEAHYAEIENEVKKFNNMVEVHLELSEAEREWNDFWYDVVQDVDDDDFAKQIEKSFGKLDSLILGTDNDVSVLTGHLNDTVTEVEALIASANRGGEDSLFGDDTAAAKENLEDYRDKLMKALTEAKEEVDNISENYIKMLEHAQDLIDDQVDGWESIGDHLEHNMELIKLVSGDKAFDALNKQYEKQYQDNLNLINVQKQSQDFWAGEIERYKQLLEVTDKNTVQWKTYSEALEKASENYKKAIGDLDKTVEEALKNLEEWRKNQSDAIMDAIDKAMSGGLGLDLVEQEWKLINDQAGKYLDNVQRAYSMEEYANELDKAANATGLSATNQAKLNAFREQELAQLREKDKLTKYDIEESRARLAILQQQLALEDAQRNKSNMRLRRDSQGNYTYQYTADQDAVDEAEGGLLNAKKEWYELVKARRKETNDWIIEAEKNLASILAQIDEAEKAGDVDRLNKLKDMELLIRQEVQDAYAEAGKNIQDIYNGVAIYFADVNNAAILPENAAVVSQLIKDWAGEGEESFLGAVKKALIDITGLQEEFGRKTEAILEEAGINYTKLKEKGIDPVDESLEDLQMDNEDLAIALEDVNDQLTTQEGNLRQVEAAYYALQSAAVSAIQSANTALVALAQTAVQTQMQVAAAIAAARNATAITGSYYDKGSNTGGGSGGNGTKGLGDRLTNNTNQGRQKYTITRVTDYYNGGKAGYVVYDNEIGATVHTTNGQTDGRIYNASGSNFSNYLDKDELEKLKKVTFATGGYTGSWPDSSGKLAVLHQKELVLNESDTKNILGAVEAIRALDFNGVAKSLVQSANIQAQVLASVGESVLQALNVNQGDSVSNYRNVTVNADFSGVRSADAIYQALMELENTGMQTSFAN